MSTPISFQLALGGVEVHADQADRQAVASELLVGAQVDDLLGSLFSTVLLLCPAIAGLPVSAADGDTFESDYTRIEGIREGKPEVTIKAGQAIWPEWTGEDTAENIAGNRFVAVDGVWFSADGAPALAAA